MARLPLLWNDPNGATDQNNWGSILKTFLQVAHNADGTLITALPVSNPVITGSITFPTPSTPAAGESITNQNNALTFSGGSAGVSWNNQANTQQRMALTDAGLLTVGAGLTVSTGSLTVFGTGPHAIGGATTANYAVSLAGAFSPTSGSSPDIGANFTHTINGQVGFDARFFNFGPLFNKAASGTHVDVSTQFIQPPTIAGGAATITNATTVKITGAPSGATNNYALWVAGGQVRLDTQIANGSVATTMSSVGPVGSHTTIQEWLQITTANGVRYIPCF